MDRIEDIIKMLPIEEREYIKKYFSGAPQWLIDSLYVVNIEENQVFVEEGFDADNIFFLLIGRVSAMDRRVYDMVYKHYEFKPMEVFGAMECTIGSEKYLTTLMTEEDSIFLKIGRKMYEKWLEEDQVVFRMQTKRTEEFLLSQVRRERLNILLCGSDRVKLMICELYEGCDEKKKGTVCLSRRQFVERTGLSERTVTRILKDLEVKGLLSRRGWDVVVSSKQYQEVKNQLEVKVL